MIGKYGEQDSSSQANSDDILEPQDGDTVEGEMIDADEEKKD